MSTIYYQVIDFSNKKSALSCRRALIKLKSTVSCSEPMQYYFSQTWQEEHALYVHTTMTEEQLDHWLYSVKASGDYIGCTLKLDSQ
jgi:hypothetical protein